jgi:hypothetical protein
MSLTQSQPNTPANVTRTESLTIPRNNNELRNKVNPSTADSAELARQKFLDVTKPFTNERSTGFSQVRFYSGFRNQIMAFSSIVMWADIENHKQLLIDSFLFTDTYGTDKMDITFDYLFDVAPWNSFYPALPRMVTCQGFEDMFKDFDCRRKKWIRTKDATMPYTRGAPQNIMFLNYMRYSKGRGPLVEKGFRNPVDLLILRGALRPHPDLQAIVDQKLASLHFETNMTQNVTVAGRGVSSHHSSSSVPYMTLHARVEPDMQKHPMCRDKKVANLTDIFRMLEEKFPEPPAPHVFMPINRQYMEKEGYPNLVKPEETNWLAVENLKVLNRAISHGLWNGEPKYLNLAPML